MYDNREMCENHFINSFAFDWKLFGQNLSVDIGESISIIMLAWLALHV